MLAKLHKWNGLHKCRTLFLTKDGSFPVCLSKTHIVERKLEQSLRILKDGVRTLFMYIDIGW